MKQITFIFNVFCMLVILFSILSVYGMEKNYTQLVLQEYNDNKYQLISVPAEVLIEKQSLENGIRILMKLKMACKKFNKLLTFKAVGKLCQSYSQNEKNQTLKKLISSCSLDQRRLPALILVCAGADIKTQDYAKFLFEGAVHTNDLKMVEVLFKYHANPNEIVYEIPILFRVKTRAIAQMFIDNRVDLQLLSEGKNILWHTTKNEYTSDLMAFYIIKHQMDAETLSKDKSCLLHEIAGPKNNFYHDLNEINNYTINDVDDFLKKAQLLLWTIPAMINQVNESNETPLEVAYKSWFYAHEDGTPEAFEKLMQLFVRYGGVRSFCK